MQIHKHMNAIQIEVQRFTGLFQNDKKVEVPIVLLINSLISVVVLSCIKSISYSALIVVHETMPNLYIHQPLYYLIH